MPLTWTINGEIVKSIQAHPSFWFRDLPGVCLPLLVLMAGDEAIYRQRCAI
jgi:hypothetical protein